MGLGSCCAALDRKDIVGRAKVSITHGNSYLTLILPLIEFWNVRIRASNPPRGLIETRIPNVPDQTEFLKTWYDYHRGYRIEKREDGTEDRVAVRGELLGDVAPGYLPRSLSDLRASPARTAPHGTTAPVDAELEGTRHGAFSTQNARIEVSDPAPNIRESRLDHLNAIPSELLPPNLGRPQNDSRLINVVSGARESGRNRAIEAEYQSRRIAALRRELQRMRNGIERVMAGLNELGEHLPESQDAIRRSTNLDQQLESIQNRLEVTSNNQASLGSRGESSHQWSDARPTPMTAAQQPGTESPQNHTPLPPPGETSFAALNRQLDLASADLEHARRLQDEGSRIRLIREGEVQVAAARVRRLERELQILEQNTRIFGSREEVERLGPNYESPIANMFNRAYVWQARVQEEGRRQQEPATGGAEVAMHNTETAINDEGIAGVQRALADPNSPQHTGSTTNPWPGEAAHADLDQLIAMQSRLFRELGERGVYNEQHAERIQELHHRTGNMFAHPPTIPSSATSLTHPWQLGAPAGARERYRREFRASHNVEVFSTAGTGNGGGGSSAEERPRSLDDDDGRPAPKSDDEMTTKMDCKVCYSQIADIAVTPCGHLVMCEVKVTLHSRAR